MLKSLSENRYLRNSGWIIYEKIIRILINLYVLGSVAKYLGPEQFGTLSYGLGILAIITPLWSLGINQIIKRDIALNPDNQKGIIISGTIIKLFSALFIMAGMNFYYFFIAHQYSNLMFINLIMASLVIRCLDVVELFLDSFLMSKMNNILKTSSLIISSILYLCFIKLSLSLVWFAIPFLIEFAISSVGYLFMLYKMPKSDLSIKLSTMCKEILTHSYPLIICDLFIILQSRYSFLVLGKTQNGIELSNLGIAFRFSDIWMFIPVALTFSYYNLIIESSKANPQKFHSLLTKLLRSVLLYWVVYNLFFLPLAPYILRFFYSDIYISALKPLYILNIANLFLFLGIVQEPIDLALNLIRYRIFRAASGLITYFICLYFVFEKNAIGVSLSTAIAYFVTYVISNLFYQRSFVVFKLQVASLSLGRK